MLCPRLPVLSDSALCDYQHDLSQELRKPRHERILKSDEQLIADINRAKTEVGFRGLDCSRYSVSDEVECRTNAYSGITRCN